MPIEFSRKIFVSLIVIEKLKYTGVQLIVTIDKLFYAIMEPVFNFDAFG